MATRHVFETYVRATPERVWEALTQPEFTRQFFFGLAVSSGWEPGGTCTYDGDGGPAVEGVLEEVDPPRRLVMTFRMLFDPVAAAEEPSRVTWELTPVGDTTRVTCIHGDLARSPQTWRITASGWSIVLAGLKTVVETGAPLGHVPDDGGSAFEPPASAAEVDRAWHRRNGVECNNGVYGFLDRTDRTADDDARMIHMAHASAYHWGFAGGPEHQVRAEYLLGRVYAYLARPEPALFHASRALALADAAGLADFDRWFVHEGMARALACAGRLVEAAAHLDLARATPVADAEDLAICQADAATGPWYGLSM